MSNKPDATTPPEKDILHIPIPISDLMLALRLALVGKPFRNQHSIRTPLDAAAHHVAQQSRGSLKGLLSEIVGRMLVDPEWQAEADHITRHAFLKALQNKIASGVRGIKRADMETLSRRLLGWQEGLSGMVSPADPVAAPASPQPTLLPDAEAEPGDAVARLVIQAADMQAGAAALLRLARQAQRDQVPGPLPVYRPQIYQEREASSLEPGGAPTSLEENLRYRFLRRTQVRGPDGCWGTGVVLQAPNGHTYALTDEEFDQRYMMIPGRIEYWVCLYQPNRYPDASGNPPPPLRYVVHAWNVECLTAEEFVKGVVYALEDDPEGLMIAPVSLFERTYKRLDGASNG